ncbi:MAG: phosphotransferase [Chloroflexi bacterium]|nr:phosphotransferase [Chloroflexota bacterium]
MDEIPTVLARTIVEVYGAAGAEWLGRLPATIAECAQRWSLRVMPPFNILTYSYVAPAVGEDGKAAVLKASVPSLELLGEIEALRYFNGHGSVKLLDADAEKGVLLLERLQPGTLLSGIEDDERATSIAAAVMRQLWRPLETDHPFPTIGEQAQGLKKMRDHFGGGCGPFPRDLVEAAEALFDQLIGSVSEPVLLHGDLHHGNILLSAERESWLAIDPKGLLGEPEYEVGAMLRNPMPGLLAQPRPERILARRLDQLSEELDFDRERLVGWGLAQAVLAAWWSYEDHGRGWEPMIACAELF